MKTLWWPAIAACLVLVGCAAPGGPHERFVTGHRPECPGATCKIDVIVECSGTCSATADPKVVVVLNQIAGTKLIQWNLTGEDGFRFADGGVTFESGAPFDCDPPQSDRVVCHDRHNGPGAYSYTLDVVRIDNPTIRIPVDPWVVNK